MLSNEEKKKWILENCVKDGNIYLNRLDFSDFDGDVYINGLKVKNNLYQNCQTVGKDLNDYAHCVGKDLIQHGSNVKHDLYQDHQEVEGMYYPNESDDYGKGKKINFAKINKKLNKLGWEFCGHDYLNFAELFIKKYDNFHSQRVLINKRIIDFEPIILDGKKIIRNTATSLNIDELSIFLDIFKYTKKTGKSYPQEYATSQKELDNAYKFEIGDTECVFENGSLTCKIREDK